jgi:hypothetical protein
MPNYRRANIKGGVFFFTVVLANRSSDLLIREIDRLRQAYRAVRQRRPFETIAVCILPDHTLRPARRRSRHPAARATADRAGVGTLPASQSAPGNADRRVVCQPQQGTYMFDGISLGGKLFATANAPNSFVSKAIF